MSEGAVNGGRLVIGHGPDALRAAAALAAGGEAVCLVQCGPGEAGLRHPEMPVDPGLLRVSDEDRAAVESVLGPLVEAPGLERSLSLGGHRHPLPLSHDGLLRVLPGAARRSVVGQLLRSRMRNTAADLVGGGQEERSHKDWVVRRMGGPAWELLYRGYAERRWGLPSEELGATMGRVYHGGEDPGPHRVVGGGQGVALAHCAELVRQAGGQILSGAVVSRLVVEGGKVAAVELADGRRLSTQGQPLWVTVSPAVVAGWLGQSMPVPLQGDAAWLGAATALRVGLRGSTGGLALETHVADAGAPFWRVVRPYGQEDLAVFHSTAAAGEAVDEAALVRQTVEAASRLGLGDFSAQGAKVEVIPGWQPAWRTTTLVRHRYILLYYRSIGLVSLGRAGSLAALDPGEELRLALHLRGQTSPDQVEAIRVYASPPVKVADLHASMRAFVAR
jgi:hypothetical protein